jgi:exopolyphosphatase/pppGpp-phosphohydrolase
MNATFAIILLAVAIAVIIGLCIYAWMLRKEVGRREAYRREEDTRAQQNSLENLDYVASALVQQQVDITEGAWRCKVLLEIIDPSLTEKPQFQAFAELYNRTKHLKTHSARQQLTPRERMQEDKERLIVEDEMRKEVLDAAQAVLEWRAKGPSALH